MRYSPNTTVRALDFKLNNTRNTINDTNGIIPRDPKSIYHRRQQTLSLELPQRVATPLKHFNK